MVTTDDRNEPYTQLTVRTFIPELVRIEPAAIKWMLNAENGARTFTLTLGSDVPIQVIGVRASDDRLLCDAQGARRGGSFEITVTTASTAQPLRGVVRIETNYPPERPKVFNVPVEIAARRRPATTGDLRQSFPLRARGLHPRLDREP